MIRPSDQFRDQVDRSFWGYVEKMDGGSMTCKFCGHLFSQHTSISRIKLHLSGVASRGVKICGQVPQDVQDAARAAIDGPTEKKHKTVAGSSNGVMAQQGDALSLDDWIGDLLRGGNELLERGHFIETTSFNPADEPRGDASEPTNDQLCSPSVNNDVSVNDAQNIVGVRTEPAVQVPEQSNAGTTPAAETMGHAPGRSKQEYMRSLEAYLMGDGTDNGTGGGVQPSAGASSFGGLTGNTNKTPGDPLPTSSTKPVGRAFDQNTNQIWSWLMDNEVSTIGIYGMGGVGKTTMLKHIHNKLLGRRDICHSVYWVTVSRDFSIERLQNLIAKCIKLDLSSQDDVLCRAAKLSKELRKKQKWILILDDLWNTFELLEVGIPDPVKGCKLIMTTRSAITS